jgi:hypothetical protein
LPSPIDLIFILLFFALTYGALAPAMLGDADIGWHIRNGQNILSTHAIPHSDSFSAAMSGRPWFAWEWLYDAVIALIHSGAGLNGVVGMSAFIIALTFACVFAFARKRGAALLPTLLFLVLCLVASSIHFLARPHVVGWLFTIAWFWILDSSQRSAFLDSRADPAPILLPLLMLFWVNLHGSFVMGFMLLAIYIAADLLAAWRPQGGETREGARLHAGILGAVAPLTILTSLLNPYGYNLHIHVYHYLSSSFLMHHIQEFRAPNFHGLPAQFFLLLVIASIAALIRKTTRPGWTGWLMMAFSIFSGFWAARNLPIASMLLTIVAASLFRQREQQPQPATFHSRIASLLGRLEKVQSQLHGHVWPIILIATTILVCANQGRLLGPQLLNAHFSEQRFPVRAVDFLVQRGNREPIFSLDTYGGYLIYRLYPNTKVFVDDRHDFYGEEYLKKYLKVVRAEAGWERVLDEWQVNLAVLPTQSKISEALRAAPGWIVLHSDSTATLFQRKS